MAMTTTTTKESITTTTSVVKTATTTATCDDNKCLKCNNYNEYDDYNYYDHYEWRSQNCSHFDYDYSCEDEQGLYKCRQQRQQVQRLQQLVTTTTTATFGLRFVASGLGRPTAKVDYAPKSMRLWRRSGAEMCGRKEWWAVETKSG